jgi:hypothetical protein
MSTRYNFELNDPKRENFLKCLKEMIALENYDFIKL